VSAGVLQGNLPSLIQGVNIVEPHAIYIANGFLYVANFTKASKFTLAGTLVEDYPQSIGQSVSDLSTAARGIHVVGEILYIFRHLTTTMTIYATDLTTTVAGAIIATYTTASSGYPAVSIFGYGNSLYCTLQSGTASGRAHEFILRGMGAPATPPGSSIYKNVSMNPAAAIKAITYGGGKLWMTDGNVVSSTSLVNAGVGYPIELYAYRAVATDDVAFQMYGTYYSRIK